jgi:hypothetical protein
MKIHLELGPYSRALCMDDAVLMCYICLCFQEIVYMDRYLYYMFERKSIARLHTVVGVSYRGWSYMAGVSYTGLIHQGGHMALMAGVSPCTQEARWVSHRRVVSHHHMAEVLHTRVVSHGRGLIQKGGFSSVCQQQQI